MCYLLVLQRDVAVAPDQVVFVPDRAVLIPRLAFHPSRSRRKMKKKPNVYGFWPGRKT